MNAIKKPIRVPVHHQININPLSPEVLTSTLKQKTLTQPFEELKPV
jgi:hypothetical protein